MFNCNLDIIWFIIMLIVLVLAIIVNVRISNKIKEVESLNEELIQE